MRTLKVSVNTGWTNDKGEEIIMKAEGSTLDEAVDNAQLYVVKDAPVHEVIAGQLRMMDVPPREVHWKDCQEFHPDTIESMIYTAWFDAIEKELENDPSLECGHVDRNDSCPICLWDSQEPKN